MKYAEREKDLTSVLNAKERQKTRQYPNRKEAMNTQRGSIDIALLLL
jgi:hypothetical protein